MTTRALRIDWNKQETDQVLAEYHRLTETEGGSQKQRLMKAQAVLPPPRRRANPSSNVLWTFNKKYEARKASGHIPKPAPVQPPAPETPADDNNAGPIVVVEKKVIVREQPDYGRIPTVTLARILLERLAHLEEVEASMFHLNHSLEQKRKAETAYDRRLDPRPAPEQPKEEALRIVIIGLLPNQQHEVESRVQNIARPLKLRFYDSQNGPQDLPQIVDYAICARFINHTWWNKAKNALPADCVFFIDGGVQAVVQKIYDLSARQNPARLNGTTVVPGAFAS